MGAQIDTGSGKSVNVDLNITPFVDLLVCLTAFLLVTAVWQNLAQINIKPKGISRDAQQEENPDEQIQASILIAKDKLWFGLSKPIEPPASIPKTGEDYDWAKLQELLVKNKKAHFVDREDIEIAAANEVTYQSLIDAMDRAIQAGFKDVNLMDPPVLSVKFTSTF